MSDTIRIECPDGKLANVKVLMPDGTLIPNVTRAEIILDAGQGIAHAVLTICPVTVNVTAARTLPDIEADE